MGNDLAGRRQAAALTQEGVDLFFKTFYNDALARFDAAIELDPAFARPYAAKAFCLMQLGNPREGLSYANKALALDPNNAVYYTTRGFLQHRLADDEGAVADFARAVELDPGDFRVYYNVACYWAERGDEAECRFNLEQAVELAPGHFGSAMGSDPDLARYAGREWFHDLLASLKERYSEKS
jgi:Flp pilus assembly protein TadD